MTYFHSFSRTIHGVLVFNHTGGLDIRITMSGSGKYHGKLPRSRDLISIKIVAREGASLLAVVEQVATAKHLTTSLVDRDVEPSSS